MISPGALSALTSQGSHVPIAEIVLETSVLVSSQATARTTRGSAGSPLAFGIGVAWAVGTIADEASVLASVILPFALGVGGALTCTHVLTLEATSRELTDPRTELTSVAVFRGGEDVATGVTEVVVLVPLASRIGVARSSGGVRKLASGLACGVGGKAGFIAWASVKRQGRAERLALHQLGIPLTSGRIALLLIQGSTTESTGASDTRANGGSAPAVASDTSAVVTTASSPLAARSSCASGTGCDERTVVGALSVGPHAVTIGETSAACQGFRADLFAVESI